MTSRPNLRFWSRLDANPVWTLADSAASSASNFVLGSLIALRSTPELYGRFALAFALYSLTFGVWRAWAVEPFLLGVRSRSFGPGSVVGACANIGGGAMILGLVVASGVGGDGRSLILAVAFSLPVLAAHDGVRYCLIGSQRAHLALVVDVLWLVLMIVGSTRISTPTTIILWWTASGALTLVAGLQLLEWPTLSGGRSWLRQTAGLGARFVFEFLIFTGSNIAIMFAVGFSSGLSEIGAYRGAAVLVGPVAVVVNGLVTVVLAMGVTHGSAGDDPKSDRRIDVNRIRARVQKLAALSLLVGVGWSVAVVFLPSSIGERILGATWTASHPTAVPLSLAVGGQALISIATAGYRLLGQVDKGVRLKAVGVLLTMVGGSAASFGGGAFEASVGFAIAAISTGTVIVGLFRRDVATLARRRLDREAVDVSFAFNETDPLV